MQDKIKTPKAEEKKGGIAPDINTLGGAEELARTGKARTPALPGDSEAHTHADGVVHTHVSPDGTVHTHTHSHEHTRAVQNRLSRAIGHLESIKRMVEDGRDCSEVLIQLAAVRSALGNTGKVILEDHINHCIVDAVESGDMEAIEELNKAISYFIK